MSEDIVMRLLRQVKSGEVSLEDARFALEDVNLTEEEYITAVDHGVFNMPKPGTIVRSSISPSASTWLVTIVFVWGLFWTIYWAGGLAYGLFNHWDQQILAFFLAMMLTTIIIMGIVYLKWVMPDTLVVKHRRNKYITPKDPNSWKNYKV
ncbi:MAG: hypothetical protein CMB50_01615 [Euryarchaeota archaeon]|nr:hypothetical protein [Euryarchaeota archaeon]|tara:strand:+ start:112 stop:561 length:450 start_codon:yes stop_codon:yes gene_type:complete